MASRVILSKENKFYKLIKKLKDKKYREKERAFLAEGFKIFELNKNPKYIILKNSMQNKFDFSSYNNKYIFEDFLFDEITSQENSQGVIFVYEYPSPNIENILGDIVILDQVQDPGNLGTIIRTLDAIGLKSLILIKGTVDVYNEKTVRSSMGSIFNLNFHYMNYDELFSFLEEKNYNIISTALDDDSVDYTQMRLKEKNAIVFGNEGNGISKKILNKSNEKVIIPIYGSAESLNVGIAVGVVMYKYIELKKL
ncbi:TrmH family RNA methyltransferase [Haliovirga abyssi]|uniref:RNA methyltransferase n=1 Tax=Haliovirga abyssi TaxID=2996794 RepID=A0AAU9DA21_9FUSO|nr:RNA methyltransferase [Haliovirga abyssi]BDU50436.1 RNA methyltransferase [Haliovirga abyssi]